MKILIIGATGATGRLLLEQLLISGHRVTAIVRSLTSLPEQLANHVNLTTVEASILDLEAEKLQEIVKDCNAVASCLGHNLTFKGIFGKTRNLVTEAVIKLCGAIKAGSPKNPVKFVLMNTTGNRNRNIKGDYSPGDRIMIGLFRLLLPPQRDNENAAEFLRLKIGQNDNLIQWVALRPDSLTDMDQISAYQVFPSPIRSPIFNAGKTSRINVADFMSKLLEKKDLWEKWKGQMPVLYNIS